MVRNEGLTYRAKKTYELVPAYAVSTQKVRSACDCCWYMLIWMQVMWLCKICLPEDVLWFGRDIYWSKHVTRNWHIKQLKQKNKCDCQFSIAIMFFRKFVYDELALSFSRSILIQNNFLSTDNHSKYWKLAPRILIPILQYFNLSEVILLLR